MNEDPKIIYLQPDDDTVDPDLGRMWCEDQDMFESDNPGTKYVRADLVEILKDALPEPKRLRLLAYWFDIQSNFDGGEIQSDLRLWSDKIEAAQTMTAEDAL